MSAPARPLSNLKSSPTLNPLEALMEFSGEWTGTGRGEYPTIEPFEYTEQLVFEPDRDRALLHYEQRTLVTAPGRASHWESGFVRVIDEGKVQITNSQNSGRVEVLEGSIYRREGTVVMELSSVLLDNDPRMVESTRLFEMTEDRLSYSLNMATRTTEAPQLLGHLKAALSRGRGSMV